MLLIGILLFLSGTICSPPATFNQGRRKSCNISSNTQTLLLRSLNHFPVDVAYFRSSTEVLLMATRNVSHSRTNKQGKPPTKTDSGSYDFFIEELFAVAWDKANFLIDEVLVDLNTKYPGIDHVNRLHYIPSINSSTSLLHVAVRTDNRQLIDYLNREYGNKIRYNIKDLNGMSPAEVAEAEGPPGMLKYLIQTFPSIIFEPFSEQVSLVHYAAFQNRTDILSFINDLKVYNFKKIYPEQWNFLTPIELALDEGCFEAADILFLYSAPLRVEIIQAIFVKFMEIIPFDYMPTFFMVTHFPAELLYCKNWAGLDLMQLAIKNEFVFLVEILVGIGYLGNVEDLMDLTKSDDMHEILKNLIKSEQK